VEIDFSEYLVKGVAAIGKRISSRVVKKLVVLKEKKGEAQDKIEPASLLDLTGKKERSGE
jgi:hypothetical protein